LSGEQEEEKRKIEKKWEEEKLRKEKKLFSEWDKIPRSIFVENLFW
jgi:hypothetical protein